MAAPRASWKGFLKIGEVTCAVALYAAASTSSRIAFHTINRKTGNRLHRRFIDAETGKPVDTSDQVKGYEIAQDRYVVLTPEEVASALPDSDKTLAIEAFVKTGDIDDVYLDRPYYLAPADAAAEEAFTVIREGLRRQDVAALTQTVLFRRVRTLLIRAHDSGLIASTLHFDYEVRSAKDAFASIPAITIDDEMLELARHIIKTKQGKFDIRKFDNRYEAALADLVRAKLDGRKITPRKEPERKKVVDLREALRASAGLGKGSSATASTGRKKAASGRSTGRSSAEPRKKAS